MPILGANAAAIAKLRATWPRFEREIPVFVVPPREAAAGTEAFVYDRRLGLMLRGTG